MTESRGFTLVEVLAAILLLSLLLLAAVPMFTFATRSAASGEDLTRVAAAASDRLELLRASLYGDLTAGGSLTSDASGYYDNSNAFVTVRWQISVSGVTKTIAVRASARRQVFGATKALTLRTQRVP